MKKLLVVAVVVVVTFVLSVAAFAVPAGKTVEFDPKGAGKVVFDGKIHADKGLKCHANVPKTGKHKVHLNMDMKCKDCHKPHLWKVTEASAKKDCVSCHEYRSPKAFL